MELLYLWINESENGIFKNQEVAFTSKYNISVCFNNNICQVDISENEQYFNIFENNVIKNCTALVGSNGAGKTTLLKYIYKNDIMPKYNEDRLEYQKVAEKEYKHDKTLQIFENSNKIIVIHNFEKKVVVPKGIEVIQMNRDKFVEMNENKSYLNSITKIYITNGNYIDENGYALESGEPDRIVLSLGSIRTFSNDFYNKCVCFPHGLIENNLYNGLQNMIVSTKTDMEFQSICDILYFDKLFRTQNMSRFAGKISTEIHISSKLLPTILNKMKTKKPSSYDSHLDYPTIVENKIKLWVSFIRKTESNVFDLNICMKLNLIFELDFIYNVIEKYGLSDLLTAESAYSQIRIMLKKFCEIEHIEYYKNAIAEIDDFEGLTLTCNLFTNLYPESDMACEKKVILSYDKDPTTYLNFISFINNTAMKKFSFIFKYLNFENLKMSSGERAYLNFFSWINLLRFFHEISDNVMTSTRRNILLLIDEIELYCHAEWQRHFMNFLLEELSEQFDENKIQIIFATHSPIVLSDIPLSNTVYITKNEEGQSCIEKRAKHKETFAANIYKLFDDSFFLGKKGAVGEFARITINSIFKDLNDALEKSSIENGLKKDRIKFIIDSIGEPIIKNRLNDMYKKVFSEDKDMLLLIQNKRIIELQEQIRSGKIVNSEGLITLHEQLKKTLEEVDKLLPNEGDSI